MREYGAMNAAIVTGHLYSRHRASRYFQRVSLLPGIRAFRSFCPRQGRYRPHDISVLYVKSLSQIAERNGGDAIHLSVGD